MALNDLSEARRIDDYGLGDHFFRDTIGKLARIKRVKCARALCGDFGRQEIHLGEGAIRRGERSSLEIPLLSFFQSNSSHLCVVSIIFYRVD